MTDAYQQPKPPKTIDQQIELLQERGMSLDVVTARKALMQVNYYRLSGYWFTFQNKRNDSRFRDGTSLDQILEIYTFDRKLRVLLFEYVSIMEIRARSAIAYYMALEYGTFAHLEPSGARDLGHHNAFIEKYRTEIGRQKSKALFVKHNLETYGELPVWAAVEVMTLGTLSKLYGNIASTAVKKRIAGEFMVQWRRLKNWLEVLSYIRNTCAHHQRIYDKSLPLQVSPLEWDAAFDQTSLFAVFLILKQMSSSDDSYRWDALLQTLHNEVELSKAVDVSKMGFPEDWYEVLRTFD